MPILLTYARLQLVGKDGQPFRALPLFQVSASSTGEPVLIDPFPVMQLYFRTSGFRLAPTYAKVYPGMTVADKGIGLDPTYYGLYETIYSGKPLPTTEMRRRGLPEGIIDPGGRVEGFLFFEELPRSAKPAMLRYELVNVQTGESIGTLQAALDD